MGLKEGFNMSRSAANIAIGFAVVLSLAAPNVAQAQHRGGGGFAGGAARGGAGAHGSGVGAAVSPRTGMPANTFPIRPVSPVIPPVVSPVIRPSVNSFATGVRPGAPFARRRSVAIAPGIGYGYGFGGFGYPYYSSYGYPGYVDPGYGYNGDPSYSQPAYSEPAYGPPAAQEPAGPSQTELELSYQVEQLSQQIEQLRQQQAQPPRPVPPEPTPMSTVLVFRDGHRIEIQNYAIVGQTLWVLDQRNSSKIAVADLDVDATQKENHVRGLRFQAP